MADGTLALFVATYRDMATAVSDFRQFCHDQQARGDGEARLLGAVVLYRDSDGKVSVSTDFGEDTCSDVVLAGDTGLIVGLFAPELLMAGMVDEGVGDSISQLVKRHDEGKMGVDLDVYLPPDCYAIVVLALSERLAGTERSLGRAESTVSIAVEPDDRLTIEVALLEVGMRGGDASAA